MKLDRSYQKEILQRLSEEYPTYDTAIEYVKQLTSQDNKKYIANVLYLQNHGLVSDAIIWQCSPDGLVSIGVMPFPQITDKGLDFLMEDGGLSAILEVKTIKIHPDSIKALLIERISQCSAPQEEKDAMIESVKNIPAMVAQKSLDKLLDIGLDRAIQIGVDLLT